MNGKMYEWPEWIIAAETTADIAVSTPDQHIPLACPNPISRLYGITRCCGAKLIDTNKKRRLRGKPERLVRCGLCPFSDWRRVGKLG